MIFHYLKKLFYLVLTKIFFKLNEFVFHLFLICFFRFYKIFKIINVKAYLSIILIFSQVYFNQCPNLMDLSHVLNPPKTGSIERRLKSWNYEYDFKRNQPYLSRGFNLSRGSNSLNSASAVYINFSCWNPPIYQIIIKSYLVRHITEPEIDFPV